MSIRSNLNTFRKDCGKVLLRDPILGRILTNNAWLLSANGIMFPIGLFQSILVARALGVEQFGTLGIIVTFVQAIRQLFSFRMNEFVVKFVSDALNEQKREKLLAFVEIAVVLEVCSSLLAFGLTLLFAQLAGQHLLHASSKWVLIGLYALTTPIGSVSETSEGLLQVFNKFQILSGVKVIHGIVLLVGVLIVLLTRGGMIQILFAYVFARLVRDMMLAVSAINTLKKQVGNRIYLQRLDVLEGKGRNALSFLVSTNLSKTLSLITRDSDQLWLGYFSSPTEVGYYRLAVSLTNVVLMPVSSLPSTTYPEVARQISQECWASVRLLLTRLTAISAAYIIPALGVLCIASPVMIDYVYGEEYVPAAAAILLLAPGLAFANILYWARPVLLAFGRADYLLRVNVLVAGVKVVGALLLLPAWGYLGNAVLLTLLYFTGVSLLLFEILRVMRLKLSVQRL